MAQARICRLKSHPKSARHLGYKAVLFVALAATVTAGVSPAAAVKRPDLSPAFQSVSPTKVVAGGQVVASVKISNMGSAAAPATQLSFSLVASGGPPIMLSTLPVPPIAATQRTVIVATLTVPTTVAPGKYALTATADSAQSILELNEVNNTASISVNVVAPDLVAVFQSVSPTPVVAGAQVIASVKVSNIGSAAANATQLDFSLVASSGSPITFPTSPVPPIAVNQSTVVVATLTVPTTVAPGSYTLTVTVDSAKTVLELNELNNSVSVPVDIVAAPLSPPAPFTKQTGPVFTGQFGLAADPSVLRDGSVFRMLYTCPEPEIERGAICQATSTDGLSWTNIATGSPLEGLVLRGELGSWVETLETAAFVKTATEYLLYYSGYNETVPFPSSGFAAIGLSRSSDGVNFTPVTTTPLLAPTPGGLDNDALFSPTVLQDGSSFVMLYAGHCYSDCPNGVSVSILAATSPDGQTWTKVSTPILTALSQFTWMSGGAAEPGLVQGPDGAYYLFFTGIDAVADTQSVGVARSLSPLGPWQVYPEPILTPWPGTFDEAGVLAPSVLIEGNLVRLWYLGVSATSQYAIGYAASSWNSLQALFTSP